MLSLSAVSAGYGSFQALFGVSLDVAAGEAIGVIGPNGAGKTTLMRVISGLIPLRGGSMSIEGRSVDGLPAHRMVEQGIAHVPENRRLFPRLSVEENLRIGAFIPQARRRFAEQLDWVYTLFPRLKDRRHQLAGTMSGGEQQMCAIGRGLMASPKLLMVDEPFIGLSPRFRDEVTAALLRLNREGLAILIIEQNVRQALGFSHRAYVLKAGQIAASGPSAELAGRPQLHEIFFGRRRTDHPPLGSPA